MCQNCPKSSQGKRDRGSGDESEWRLSLTLTCEEVNTMECWWPERGDMIRSFTGFKTGKGEKKKKSGTDRINCCTSCGCEGPTCFFLVCRADFREKMGVGFWTWQPWGFPEWTCCMGNWLAHLRGSGVPRRDLGWRYPRDGGEWSGSTDWGLYLEGRMLRFLFQMSLQGADPACRIHLQRGGFLCSKVFLAGLEEWLADQVWAGD